MCVAFRRVLKRERSVGGDDSARFVVHDTTKFEELWSETVGGNEVGAYECVGSGVTRKVSLLHATTIDERVVCRLDFKDIFESSTKPLGGADFAVIAESVDAVFLSDLRGFNR